MKTYFPNLNILWASLLVEELRRNGVNYFCLAPGSRCTPLTVAVAENKNVEKSIHYDERGVGFHALGYGRATGKPAAIITTSGTAVPNLFPAVVEAAMERIPLVLITADRPPELRDTSANQTIDQVKIFGNHVRWFVDLPCPDLAIVPEFVLTTVDQARYRCKTGLKGPVHINCMFREPLAPESQGDDFTNYLSSIDQWLKSKNPYTKYLAPLKTIDKKSLEDVLKFLQKREDGLVVLGGLPCLEDRRAVSNLIKKLNWPVCADVTSNLAMRDTLKTVIPHSDILTRNNVFTKTHSPSVILHIGGRLISKHLSAFLSKDNNTCHIMITNHPERHDPGHEISCRLEGDISLTCNQLAQKLSIKKASLWLESWQKKSYYIQKMIEKISKTDDELNEPAISFLLSRKTPRTHGLFLASSMAVRNMNSFADSNGPNLIMIGANRGASGIDGTIATASGFAKGLERSVTLLIGDLAFLHDLNSLNYLKNSRYPITIVIINNNGGGIFSFLPIARFKNIFKEYFITPHDLTFKYTAKMCDLPYYNPKNREEFINSYLNAVEKKISSIIEIRINNDHNMDVYNGLLKDIQDNIKKK